MNTSSLRVLIVGLNYAPEPTGNAPYTTKLAEGLEKLGASVNVIAGYPHYPAWKVADGYDGFTMIETVNGIPVTRLRHTVPSRPSGIRRLLMELTFGARAIATGWGNADLVLVVTPALFSSALVAARARLQKKPVVIWVQDLYSRGLEETRGRQTIASRLMKRMEGAILRGCSGVTVIHDRFRDYVVKELGVGANKTAVIRNWTHTRQLKVLKPHEIRRKFGWGDGEVIALHTGNMGVKQGLENVVEAARLADVCGSPVRFVLVGDGSQREVLERAGKGIRSLRFLSPLDETTYPEALMCANVLVLNELASLREMSVPSKLTSYLASGTPIVAATHESSATASEIELSMGGVRVDPGNPLALLQAVEQVGSDPTLASRLGVRGQTYASRVLGEEAGISAHAEWLLRIAVGKSLEKAATQN